MSSKGFSLAHALADSNEYFTKSNDFPAEKWQDKNEQSSPKRSFLFFRRVFYSLKT